MTSGVDRHEGSRQQPSAALERMILHRLQVPLQVPYKLAFGPVRAFDMILVESLLDTGTPGWGEATVLTGYTQETIDRAWATATALAPDLIGLEAKTAMARCLEVQPSAPFTATAFITSLEMALGHPDLEIETERRLPLLAGINSTQASAIGNEIEQHLAHGFGTLKVKVGFEVRADLERLALIQRLTGSRALLRVDANQGYSSAEALAFIKGMDPAGIELVEQTCAAGDWAAAAAVAKAARARGITMMLDESIYGPADILRAAELECAQVIKLKLMKTGGLDALARDLQLIHRRGMRPVVGNGVAGDIGCWMEACAGVRQLDNAGEMNGFLRPRTRLFQVPMRLQDGDLILEPTAAGAVIPDRDALQAHTLDRQEFHGVKSCNI